MLIEFRVQNHRSLRDEQAFTMEAASSVDKDNARPRLVPGNKERVLPVAAIYGANASGKSNVISGLQFMADAVIRSYRFWDPDEGIPRVPFAWGPHRLEPSLFEVTFLMDGVRYDYGFVVNNKKVCEEWLYASPKGRKQMWFIRDEDGFKFGDYLQGENRVVEKVTRDNALFLSTAVQLGHSQLDLVYKWFRELIIFSQYPMRLSEHRVMSWFKRPQVLSKQMSLDLIGNDSFDEEFDKLDKLRELLRRADVGIVDVRAVHEEDPGRDGSMRSRPQIYIRHESSDAEAWLPLKEESRGTLMLFHMAPWLLSALENGGVIVVDELETSLHPLLALEIVKQFNDPKTNPRNAQLIFTTHNTELLGNIIGPTPLLRDQIWLTEKDSEGATSLYPLTDYKPRKAENLERGYLQGRYGAIPFLEQLVRLKSEDDLHEKKSS